MIPVIIGAIIIVFTINFLSEANPAMIKLGIYASNPELLADMEHEMGLDRPYIIQFVDYFWGIIRGDFGNSYIYNRSVTWMISGRIGNTLIISVGALVVSVLIGIPLGLIAALKQNKMADYLTTTIAVLLNAMPSFLIAVMLMLAFAINLRWFPVSGADSPIGFILPIIAAAMPPVTANARMTRSSILEVIRQDYVRTARAKGMAEGIVISRHVFKNALIPVLTMIGTALGTSLAGAILVEMIFNLPGMGMLINTSIMTKDFITVQGCVLICAFIVTVMNLLTDLAYAAVDPRIRAQYKEKRVKKTRPTAKLPAKAS